MTESEIYAVNLHMARLTGWPDWYFVGYPELIELYVDGKWSRLWNPWEDEGQCAIVRDRLIETGRIYYYELSSFRKGEWGCLISPEVDKYNPHEDGDTPAQAMCRAFVKLEVAT